MPACLSRTIKPGTSDVSPWSAGLRARCPRCGKGTLFKGFLTVAERCTVCDLDLSKQDSGDGPAVFVILILGAVAMGLFLAVEAAFSPPKWVHIILWPPLILIGSILMLRPFKAVLIALQYRHRRDTYSDGT